MSRLLNCAFAGVSLIALAAPALAQTSGAAPRSDVAAVSADNPGEIVVNARRREERLQDVPKVVNAVTADDLRKNNIQKLDDVASIVPGINLQNAGNGETQNATMRGAAFDVDSGLSPTVQFYLNDANIAQNFVFQSMYDVGQIEVLRGPQGTLRGRSAPSGSITLTTKLPDLYKWGGYVDLTGQTKVNGLKGDYALNAPLIPGRLALRVAGTLDDNEIASVHSIYPQYTSGPYDRTWSERVSARAVPVDELEINVMYQHLVTRQLNYLQTESTCLIDSSQPCGSGQLISAADRLSTINGQRKVYENSDIINGRVDDHIFGQKISYVGQYAVEHIQDEEPEDGANTFPGQTNPDQKISGVRNSYQTHEIRLSSEERIAKIFDYTVGFMTYYTKTDIFGGSGPEDEALAILNSPAGAEGNNSNWEISYFGNITAHPTDKLEISGGARHILFKAIDPLGGSSRTTDNVWSASASYHFTPSIMAYANAGSAFRPQGANLGFAFIPFQVSIPPADAYAYYGNLFTLPKQYSQLLPEKSKSYEIGLKTQFLNHKLTFNVDYYHQDFTNYQFVSPDFIAVFLTAAPKNPYTNPDGLPSIRSPQIVLGTENVPAKVDGVEGDVSYRYSREGNIGANFSYANGRITGGGTVPCAGPVSQATPVATCPAGPSSYVPRFSATVHADYAHPINSQVTGVLRGLASIEGASPLNLGNPYDKQPAYALFNVYLGVRAPDSAWEVTFFVKNLLNNETRLATYGGNINAQTSQNVNAAGVISPTTFSAYTYVATPPPRIFGLEARYAFGSR